MSDTAKSHIRLRAVASSTIAVIFMSALSSCGPNRSAHDLTEDDAVLTVLATDHPPESWHLSRTDTAESIRTRILRLNEKIRLRSAEGVSSEGLEATDSATNDLSLDMPSDRASHERSHDDSEPQETTTVTSSKPMPELERVFDPSRTAGIEIGSRFDDTEPFAMNDARSFIPASVAKLFTAALALDVLGPEFRFETRLEWEQSADAVASRLRVIGGGDPTFGIRDFESVHGPRMRALVRKLTTAGVRHLHGAIEFVAGDARWDLVVHAPGVESSDHLKCFGALSQPFNYGGNCVTLIVNGPDSHRWSEGDVAFPVERKISRGRRTALSLIPKFGPNGEVTAFSVQGTWHTERKSPYAIRLPLPNTRGLFRALFAAELRRAGIAWKPRATEHQGQTRSATLTSPPLTDILAPLLKHSDNFLADAIFKAVGSVADRHSASLLQASQFALARKFEEWTNEAGFSHMRDELLLLEGAGLSRDNRITPRAMVTLLKLYSAKPHFTYLWRSLPIAGIDGTLANRLRDPRTRGIVRAKTGTVSGAYQLAGYIPRYDVSGRIDKLVPFVILISTQPQNRKRVLALHDRALIEVVREINPTLPPANTRQAKL